MHILLLNEYYPPDTSATAKMAAQVAEALAQRHQVTVVAGRPSYDPDARYPYALLRRDTRNKVTVECVGSTAFPRHQMLRRVANYLSYLALGQRWRWRCVRILFPGYDGPAGRGDRRGVQSRGWQGGRSCTTYATCTRTWRWAETSCVRASGRRGGKVCIGGR